MPAFFLPLVIFFASHCFADLAPKPTMAFTFEPAGIPAPISAQQLQCEKADCSDGKPLSDYGPQGFHCRAFPLCQSLAYGYSPYQQLIVTFPGRAELRSQVFSPTGKLNSPYRVKVLENLLEVTIINAHVETDSPDELYATRVKRPWIHRHFWLGFLATLTAELAVLLLFLRIRKLDSAVRPITGWATITSITYFALILVSFFYAHYSFAHVYLVTVAVAELLIVATEGALFYLWMGRKVPFARCLHLSLVANALSFAGTYVI